MSKNGINLCNGTVAFSSPLLRACSFGDGDRGPIDVEDIFAGVLGGVGYWDLNDRDEEKNEILGSSRGQYIRGTSRDDIIHALAGNDYVRGGNGDDTIYGGLGNDKLVGENGDDTLYGGLGYNKLYGGDGDDTLIIGTDGTGLYTDHNKAYGQEGSDTFYVWGNKHYIHGADGDDAVFVMQRYPTNGSFVNDDYSEKLTIKTGDGKDIVNGFMNHSYISTEHGGDALDITGNHNKIYVGYGDDTVSLVGDYNYIGAGCKGEETICVDGDRNLVKTYHDNDEVTLAQYAYENKIYTHTDNDVITLEGFNHKNYVDAGHDDDTIYLHANSSQNTIRASHGDDTIHTTLAEGTVGNVFLSGTGNDEYFFYELGGGNAVIHGDNTCDYRKTYDVVNFAFSTDEADLDVDLTNRVLTLEFGDGSELTLTRFESCKQYAIDEFAFADQVFTTEEFLMEYGISV